MPFETTIILISLGLFVGMMGAVEAGRRVGLARLAHGG